MVHAISEFSVYVINLSVIELFPIVQHGVVQQGIVELHTSMRICAYGHVIQQFGAAQPCCTTEDPF